jgi:hypothetical protein
MIVAVICLAAALITIWRDWHERRGRQRPLDRAEIRIIRCVADKIRREQFQPFE